MAAPLEICRKRGVVAVLASGVVISLTALTGGIAPAFAQPDNDEIVTTTAAPEPELTVPEPEETVEQTTSAPEPVQTPSQPTATQAPQTQAPQMQAPQTQAPVAEPEPVVEPEPQTQAPEPPKTATAVQTAEPSTPSEPSTTVERSPVTSVAPRATQAPATTADENDEPQTSAALAPESETSEAETSEGRPSDSTETPAGESETSQTEATTTTEAGDESETPTVSIEQAAKEIETIEPQTLEAPAEDVQLAKEAKPVVLEEQPAPAAEKDVAAFTNSIESSLKIPGLEIGTSAKTDLAVQRRDVELVSNVRQWRPDWVEYDEYYRPVILNPFRAPVRIVYIYDMRPRIAYIPPLARIVLEAAQFAAYSFTAAVLNPINAAIDTVQAVTNIAVGSFFGGGYFPGAGLPLPPPPPPVLRYDNVPVLVNYSNATYEPFRVRRIVDVGEDRVYGERKVLLDGVTPVWGEWTQTAGGERQFEVHKTQQFPGLDAPAEAPLPGDYRLRLASDETSTGGLTGRDIFLMVAAGVIGTLGFGAIGLAFFLGRRRPEA